MEILMNNTVSLSKSIDVVPKGKEIQITGTDVKVILEKGELVLVPDIASGREVGDVKDIKNYVVFEDIVVINSVINYKANLVVEIFFFDNFNFDVNRYKIPFEDRIGTGLKNIRKVELKGSMIDCSFRIVGPLRKDRFESLRGLAIAKCLFRVNVTAEVQ